ncbi:MAG TPA: tetratricopeptide repeat protein [Ktedonobacteraceae bacterium]|nr:tetratricopeptide repeat protein [Ktedonobacteraceae bacterium]
MGEVYMQQLVSLRQRWILGEQVDVLASYRKLVERFPEDALVWREYGRALFAAHADEEQVLVVFEQAYALEPDSVMTLLYLGALYELGYGKGYPEAVAVYQRILELAPMESAARVDAYVGLGLLYLAAPEVPRNLQTSQEMFQEALKLNPEDAEIHKSLGLVLHERNNFARAREELKRAEQLCEEQGKPAGTLQKYLQRVEHHEPFTGGSYCAPAMVWEWPNGPLE